MSTAPSEAVVWFVDSGAEWHLAVSLGSFRLRAPESWHRFAKVVVDCGLSRQMRKFLRYVRSEGVHLVPVSATCPVVRWSRKSGLLPMRMRIFTPGIMQRASEAKLVPSTRRCLVIDADTTFTKEFILPRSQNDSDLMVMREWDLENGSETMLRLFRQSTFACPLLDVSLNQVAHGLDLSAERLLDIPTYNSGVFLFDQSARFSAAWHREYSRVLALRDNQGRRVFSTYAAEQTALAVAVARGTITHSPLPRCFNQFPPRPPQKWPTGTVIAHFITFHRNWREPRYAPWFEALDAVRADNWLPIQLLPIGPTDR